ncbi:hypothetical protein C8R46DRAFT_1134510 [Mycena filopes]|nr:hypothetical protein C8R46DRAFT_1134510 [Mycena filopes]
MVSIPVAVSAARLGDLLTETPRPAVEVERFVLVRLFSFYLRQTEGIEYSGSPTPSQPPQYHCFAMTQARRLFQMLFTATLLSYAALLVHAIPSPGNHTVKRAVNLSSSPSVRNPLTLYRCIRNDELRDTRKVGLGNYPYGMGRSRGDFNAEGTHNLYFWDDEDDVEGWCASSKTLDVESTYAIVTYKWDPPAGVKVQRYERDTNDWNAYVAWNWAENAISTTQRINDWIEGPVSDLVAGHYYASLAWGMQHTLLNPDMLSRLRITDIGGDLAALRRRGGRGRTGRRDTGEEIVALEATTMHQMYNPGEYDPDVGFAGICAGYSYGIIHSGDVDNTANGKGIQQGYAVVDNNCHEVLSTVTSNVCTEPEYGCSPEPIIINKLVLSGKQYTCRVEPLAGWCSGPQDIAVCCK